MFIHQILFSFSCIFSTAYLLSADSIQFDKPKLVDTLQNLCEQAIETNIALLSNQVAYNSIQSKQLAHCVQNKLMHIQPEAMPAYINGLPLVMQLELLDETHTYERKNGNDEERKKFFAYLTTFDGGCTMLRTILDEIGWLHVEKLERSIVKNPATDQRMIYTEKDCTWKLFPYEPHSYNKQIGHASVSVEEVTLSPTMILAPPVYINVFYEVKSEGEIIWLPIKTLKIIGWQKFDGVNQWACNESLDEQSRKVFVDYDSVGKLGQRLSYSCDVELNTTFGDGIASLFKVYNYYRSKITHESIAGSVTDSLIIAAADVQSPRACEWINNTVAARIAAQKEKAGATASSE